MSYEIILGDCLEVMPTLEAGSIDAIITDLPYGTTACAWDEVIPFAPMWAAIKRLLKPRGVFVTTASQPFTSALVMSNLEWFKYAWVWQKSRPFDIFNVRNKPLKKHEDVLIFSPGTVANKSERRMVYNPQGLVRVDKQWKRPRYYMSEHRTHRPSSKLERVLEYENYPNSVLEFANDNNGNVHPTQKPVALYAYLIRTYTNAGDTVLDFCMGSGTTGVAAIKEGRKFVGIEKDERYHAIAKRRLEDAAAQPLLFEMAE